MSTQQRYESTKVRYITLEALDSLILSAENAVGCGHSSRIKQF